MAYAIIFTPLIATMLFIGTTVTISNDSYNAPTVTGWQEHRPSITGNNCIPEHAGDDATITCTAEVNYTLTVTSDYQLKARKNETYENLRHIYYAKHQNKIWEMITKEAMDQVVKTITSPSWTHGDHKINVHRGIYGGYFFYHTWPVQFDKDFDRGQPIQQAGTQNLESTQTFKVIATRIFTVEGTRPTPYHSGVVNDLVRQLNLQMENSATHNFPQVSRYGK